MLQRGVFPLASGLPTPAERLRQRELGGAGTTMVSIVLYLTFLFAPGAVAGLSVVVGRRYGTDAYRFLVSWLFYWSAALLTLDPFVVRYRARLADLVHHWRRLWSCTKTSLTVCFEHGLLYCALLWALAYAFVFLEAILELFWQESAAIAVTTFAFGAFLVVLLVAWSGRLVRQHSHLAFSNQAAATPSASFSPPLAARFSTPVPPGNVVQTARSDRGGGVTVRVDVQASSSPLRSPASSSHSSSSMSSLGGSAKQENQTGVGDHGECRGGEFGVEVRLSGGAETRLNPTVALTGRGELDLADHLRRNGQQMTIAGDVLIVEQADRLYGCYRRLTWVLLILLGGVVLTLLLRDAFGLFALDAWAEYAALAGFSSGVALIVFAFGRKYADPTYLQFFMLLSTFFPSVYGAWLLAIYDAVAGPGTSADDTASQSTAAAMLMVLHLAMSNLYLVLMQLIVRHFSAPYLYVRWMMLPQAMSYLFELVIFGMTPWSFEYFLVLLLSSSHNVLSSTGLYGDAARGIVRLARGIRIRLCPTYLPASLPSRIVAQLGRAQDDRGQTEERADEKTAESEKARRRRLAEALTLELEASVSWEAAASIRAEADAEADRRRAVFAELLETRYTMQLFAQDTIADVWSFVVLLTALGVVYGFGVSPSALMPRFTLEPVVLRLAALVIARVASWLVGQLIFRLKLDRQQHSPHHRSGSNGLVIDPTGNVASGGGGGASLADRLDEYLLAFKLSALQTAELRTCYEEDMPELFVAPSDLAGATAEDRGDDDDDDGHGAAGAIEIDPNRLSLGELLVAQIAERQWLLHPSLLRKHILYFHAAMYLLLLVVFQSASPSLPLRYAWLKPDTAST
jgi:hypothetical protein